MVALLVATAQADPEFDGGTGPCVLRDSTITRSIDTVALDDQRLSFCTGVDCWALRLTSRAFTAIPPPPFSRTQPVDPAAALADAEAERAHGKLEGKRGHADAHAATFCPTGPRSCQTFRYAFRNIPVVDPYIAMNAEGTLGTVTLRWYRVTEKVFDTIAVTLIFDLVKHRETGRFRGGVYYPIRVLGRTILADDQYHDATGQLVRAARPANPDLAPVPVGPSAYAFVSLAAGELVIHDIATHKDRVIPLGVQRSAGQIAALVASSDLRRLYAISGSPYEGEVFTIDVATRAVVDRTSPPACPPNHAP